jgi:plasmid maintenance system killer protein
VFKANPHHPSLKFKKLPPHEDLWSVRITSDYRAIGRWRGDVIVWFFIGSHADYDNLLARL